MLNPNNQKFREFTSNSETNNNPAFPKRIILAHNVQTEGKVGVLFHIEPGHNPKAGEPAQAWFALTREGGDPISLDQCACKLTVYDGPTAIATPTLKALSPERYSSVPGADVIFPKAGLYRLELKGQPKTGEDFNTFQVSYEVTVQPPSKVSAETAAQQSRDSASSTALLQPSPSPVPRSGLDDALNLGLRFIFPIALAVGFWILIKRPR
ncbi:hypothetical protein ACN4EG_10595 [Alkalinema pantanalense CENA528]|uniref:hypothetical protein n=1 Tax=Alkalinema pantanalense TaxID=1620705 RepID=UPI003D6DADF8